MAFNIFSILNIPADLAGLKTTLIKVGIGAAFLAVLGGSGFLFYKWEEHRSNIQLAAAVAAAHSQGIADAQRDTTVATNAQLVKAMQDIATMTADTNNKLANIRVNATLQQQAIQSFDVKTTAVDHPDVVEKWANDTTNQLFGKIAASSGAVPAAAVPAPVPAPEVAK